MGYPPILITATQEELDLVGEFTDNERKMIGRGPPRTSLTPPYIHWLNAKVAIAYLK